MFRVKTFLFFFFLFFFFEIVSHRLPLFPRRRNSAAVCRSGFRLRPRSFNFPRVRIKGLYFTWQVRGKMIEREKRSGCPGSLWNSLIIVAVLAPLFIVTHGVNKRVIRSFGPPVNDIMKRRCDVRWISIRVWIAISLYFYGLVSVYSIPWPTFFILQFEVRSSDSCSRIASSFYSLFVCLRFLHVSVSYIFVSYEIYLHCQSIFSKRAVKYLVPSFYF